MQPFYWLSVIITIRNLPFLPRFILLHIFRVSLCQPEWHFCFVVDTFSMGLDSSHLLRICKCQRSEPGCLIYWKVLRETRPQWWRWRHGERNHVAVREGSPASRWHAPKHTAFLEEYKVGGLDSDLLGVFGTTEHIIRECKSAAGHGCVREG